MGYNGHCADSDGDKAATIAASAATVNQRFMSASVFVILMFPARYVKGRMTAADSRLAQVCRSTRTAGIQVFRGFRTAIPGLCGRAETQASPELQSAQRFITSGVSMRVFSLLLLCVALAAIPAQSQAVVEHFVGPEGGPGFRDGAASESRFYSPEGVWSDGANVYIADSGNGVIRRIAVATAQVTTIAGSPQ
jgi:hypothetical protein